MGLMEWTAAVMIAWKRRRAIGSLLGASVRQAAAVPVVPHGGYFHVFIHLSAALRNAGLAVRAGRRLSLAPPWLYGDLARRTRNWHVSAPVRMGRLARL